MFTDEFIKAYPTPWRGEDGEILDANGSVIEIVCDTADQEFWQNIINAVNGASARALVPDEELLRVGEKVVEMCTLVSSAKEGAEASWHFEIDEDRYRVAIRTAQSQGASH